MPKEKSTLDPRYFQVLFQLIFLCYGIIFLEWNDWPHYIICIGGCLLFNYIAESLRQKQFLPFSGQRGWNIWGFSVLISAMSLCLLIKTNHWYTSLLACFFTVSSKYFFRIGKKHLFNPSAFGIIATLIFTTDAWLSPAQWGSNAIFIFLIAVLGTIVVTRVQKLDTSLAFIITYLGLIYWRQCFVLGWPLDHFLHSISTGSLLLFGFFMISDPKTSPNHAVARIVWAMLIAIIAFYLAAFKWIYNTPIWMLVIGAPLVPILDKLFTSKPFEWATSVTHIHSISKFKKNNHEIV